MAYNNNPYAQRWQNWNLPPQEESLYRPTQYGGPIVPEHRELVREVLQNAAQLNDIMIDPDQVALANDEWLMGQIALQNQRLENLAFLASEHGRVPPEFAEEEEEEEEAGDPDLGEEEFEEENEQAYAVPYASTHYGDLAAVVSCPTSYEALIENSGKAEGELLGICNPYCEAGSRALPFFSSSKEKAAHCGCYCHLRAPELRKPGAYFNEAKADKYDQAYTVLSKYASEKGISMQ
jgi:hypothetical protein